MKQPPPLLPPPPTIGGAACVVALASLDCSKSPLPLKDITV